MTHASLFSGIGGFDLAAEWAGLTNVFHCEIDPFCQKVLNHHFPNSISYENVTVNYYSSKGWAFVDMYYRKGDQISELQQYAIIKKKMSKVEAEKYTSPKP